MAVEKRINIKVNTDDAVKNTERLANSLKKVDKEADNVNKSIDDVSSNGGAIAILDQLTGGLATRFKDAYEATKLFNFSLKGTKTALIATGVGAFVVALGAIVTYWDDIVEFITEANAKLQEQIDLSNQKLEDLGFEIKLLEAKEKILIAEGKSTKEITQQKKQILLLQQEENKLLLENLRTQLEREQSQVREVTTWEKIKIATLEAVGAYDKAAKERAKAVVGNEDERTRLEEITKQINDAQLRSEQLKLALIELNKPAGGGASRTQTDTSRDDAVKREQDRLKALSDFERELRRQDEDYYAQTEEEKLQLERDRAQAELDNLIASETEKREAQRLLDEYYDQLKLDLEVKRYEEQERLRREDLERQRKANEEELKRKQALETSKLNLTKGTLGNISEALNENSEAGKAFAAAQALINTYQGISAELATKTATPFEFGLKLVNIATTTAIGLKSVKDILSTNPKGVSASLGGSATQGAAAPSPSFNLISGSGTNQIAESIAGDRQPIKAYVVSGEMSTQQALDRSIEGNASI